MYTKIVDAPRILQLNGNQTIVLAAILVSGLCVAMLLNYKVELGNNGLKMSPSGSMVLAEKY